MDIAKIDTSKDEFTDAELDCMAEICVKAQEIQAKDSLNRLVQEHMKTKAEKLTSTAALRKKANSMALEK